MDKLVVLDTALTAGAAGAFIKAKSYEEKARTKVQNLDRLEAITMLYLGQNKKFKEEPQMKIKKTLKLFSKVSNKPLVIGGIGLGLIGAAVAKDRLLDHRCDDCESDPAITFEDVTDAAEEAASEISE